SYPDLRHYTLRDYGNRVGIWRMMRSFDRLGIRVTAAFIAAVATRYPALLEVCIAPGGLKGLPFMSIGNHSSAGMTQSATRAPPGHSTFFLRGRMDQS
ncbi:MAG: hypothetical protein ACKOUS_21120, partial [Alphaproteobacteria bacterium]